MTFSVVALIIWRKRRKRLTQVGQRLKVSPARFSRFPEGPFWARVHCTKRIPCCSRAFWLHLPRTSSSRNFEATSKHHLSICLCIGTKGERVGDHFIKTTLTYGPEPHDTSFNPLILTLNSNWIIYQAWHIHGSKPTQTNGERLRNSAREEWNRVRIDIVNSRWLPMHAVGDLSIFCVLLSLQSCLKPTPWSLEERGTTW